MCDETQNSKRPPLKESQRTLSSDENGDKKKKKNEEQASIADMMSFVWSCGTSTKLIFVVGFVAGIGNGLVFPALAYLFSTSFSSISGASSNGLDDLRELAFMFMIVGAYALAIATIQTTCFEVVSHRATQTFRLQWFKALLRQDQAFFDVYDVGGIANSVGTNSNRFRRGLGRKFGEGIQFFTTGVGGIAFALWSDWRVALVVLGVIPFASIAALSVMTLNQSKGARASKAYSQAGSVAYSTVSSIRTVLSLNALQEMLRQYQEATQEAYRIATTPLIRIGFANGSMLGSFLMLYAVLTLYGTFLLYSDIEDTGCDPSDGVIGNDTCSSNGPGVFGAMLGVAFAGQGISQVGNFVENLSATRVATAAAMKAIKRVPGAPEEKIFKKEDDDDELQSSRHGSLNRSRHSRKSDVETGEDVLKAVLPEYRIDASTDAGLKPEQVQGHLTFKNVEFSYPTRPNDPILHDLSLEIEAGKTVALVGPSGGGKSTVVSMIERFYDPLSGSVELDGMDLKDINVSHLRGLIGYVGQEPTLFATTVAGNIRYGNPKATQEQVEQAARLANAHDFVTSFPDGYETQVGDKGAQLSGGQKQRIAIARVLVGNPQLLLLDEATSALDSESELLVQDALDNVVATQKRTTIIIAHRLSTIRNADVIVVIAGGRVVEKGTHEELMGSPSGHYRKLVDKQEQGNRSLGNKSLSRLSSHGSLGGSSRENSTFDLTALEKTEALTSITDGSTIPHFHFKNVTFTYPTRPNKKIFDGFELSIRQGETIALVGPSGGGKSTTVSLIERFYDPIEGIIEYLGHDLRSLNVGWYRDQIGYVGQEPTLFNDTIARNIAYGAPGATQREIEEAAIQANAHDFIMSFPEGYDTPVGERGTQLSGGQKQRIAIARALVKKPTVLLLDEATSALDTDSEAIVQVALDEIMGSRDHTTIVIAHRLSTIRNADRIAFIADGKVKEVGSHDELINKHHGRYKRLVESQKRQTTAASVGISSTAKKMDSSEEDEEKENDGEEDIAEEEKSAFSVARARQMASPDAVYMCFGSIGALMAGGVFPMWGLLFSETIELLFRRVEYCDDSNVTIDGFETCQEYWDSISDDLREQSFAVAGYWAVVLFGCLLGNVLTFWGFGMASERLNKRVRDSSFLALVRQEVGFFDKRSVGSITSQLQDDAARIHTFSGEPVRATLVALSSVLTGIILSFAFMWPFALIALATVPLTGFATSIEMKQFLGEDETSSDKKDELNSPGGIVVETLINIRTVSALTLEQKRYSDYENALLHSEPDFLKAGFLSGFTSGMSQFIQQWVNALQLWWGGYILFNYPGHFTFLDFLIANFALLFSLFGLGAAFQDLSDRAETEKSAGRIFYLLDRQSEIDPLSEEGKKLN